jgi:predicted amidohydrolase
MDLLVLPEMAFTGYMFEDLKDIQDYLEETDGPTVQWAIQTGILTLLIMSPTMAMSYPSRIS